MMANRALRICLAVLVASVAAVTPASAQFRPPFPADDTPRVSLRPFFVGAGERFTAENTFKTVFGEPLQPLWGGGLQVAFRGGFYFDVTASRFRKSGQRAFFHEGEGFGLGIPLQATLTPLEVTAGGRFRTTSRVLPYVGAGVGWYRYEETSDFSDGPFSARHTGYLVVGGVEIRVSRWIAVSGDVQYTHVPGIIGTGGVSEDAGESNLGGTAARFRFIVGR